MGKFSKFFILVIFIVGLVTIGSFVFNNNPLEPTANIYIEDNSVSCGVSTYIENQASLENDICNYILKEIDNPKSDLKSIEEGVKNIGYEYGINNLHVKIDSEIGEEKIPIHFQVDGRSMVPTLKDGQSILVEKTKNISPNDIVVAESSQYGVIVKRVEQINGREVHLISDNKNIEYETINGVVYETKGITTWVDISDIYGVVIAY